MPRFDDTGPNGEGPMTGRGLGPCAKNNTRRDNYHYRRFLHLRQRFGRRGRRFKRGFYAKTT